MPGLTRILAACELLNGELGRAQGLWCAHGNKTG
jgi:hypothetical protein